MFIRPYLTSQIASDRHREMLAHAERQLISQVRTRSRAAVPAGRDGLLSRALRRAARRQAESPA